MRALFVAHGPAFARGVTVAPFPNVDVYPLIMSVLRLPAEANDGHLTDVKGLLAPAQIP
jgi:hypothetical protein